MIESQRPRVHVEPPSDESFGDLAAAFAADYGLTADPWQRLVLDAWLAERGGRYAALTCGLSCSRQNGKNGIIEIRELFGMVGRGEKILHTAHEVKTARKAFKRLLHFFGRKVDDPAAKFPELNALVTELRQVNGQEAIFLSNGGSVEIVARSQGSGRGFTVDVLVMDEAQDLSDDDLEALMPTTSSAPLGNPQWIFTGTPPGPRANGEVFTRTRQEALSGAAGRLAWHEWSVDGDSVEDIDLDDRDAWYRTNPALGGRLQVEVLEGERSRFSPAGFARERLGWWASVSMVGASLPGWDLLADPAAPPGTAPVFAVAAADDLSFSAISVASRRPDGLVQVQTESQGKGTAWLTDAVAELRARHSAPVLVHSSLRGVVEGDEVGPADYERACKGLLDAVEGGRLRHYSHTDPGLQGAVTSATWTATASRRLIGKGGRDICQLAAAALAVHALGQTGTSAYEDHDLRVI